MGGTPPGSTGLTNNPLIDAGTSSSHEMSLPGPLGAQPRAVHRDEITPIARYIAAEMNANAASDDVKRMAEMNRFSATACIEDFTQLPLWKQLLGLGDPPRAMRRYPAVLSFGRPDHMGHESTAERGLGSQAEDRRTVSPSRARRIAALAPVREHRLLLRSVVQHSLRIRGQGCRLLRFDAARWRRPGADGFRSRRG